MKTIEQQIATAKTARDLERVWMQNYPHFEIHPRQYEEFLTKIEARGWELVAAHPKGWRIPRLKRRGSSYTATMGEQVYKTGTWGNGAGYRYSMYYLEQWVKKTGKYRSERTARGVVDCVLWRWPHRALLKVQP